MAYFNVTPREEWRISDFCMSAQVLRERLLSEPPGSPLFKARMLLESVYEERLNKRGNSGDVFGIKQFGWRDKADDKKDEGGLSLESLLKALSGEKF